MHLVLWFPPRNSDGISFGIELSSLIEPGLLYRSSYQLQDCNEHLQLDSLAMSGDSSPPAIDYII